MKYTVVWKPNAEAKLASIWNASKDRNAVTAAANEIDTLLTRQPRAVGESRPENTRILSVSPLTIYFDVWEEDLIVEVWAVWLSTRERS